VRSVATSLGEMVFRGPLEPADACGPAIIAVGGWLTAPALIERVTAELPATCAFHFAELPSGLPPLRAAALLSRAMHKAFLGRRLVLAALADASAVAALSYAPELLRTVVVDPAVSGEDRQDLRFAYQDRRAPLDILLTPQCGLSAEDHATFAREVNVEVSEGDQAGAALARVLRDAVDWAAELRRNPLDMVRRLAAATPRTAQTIRFVGPAIAQFADAYRRFNPDGEVRAAGGAVDVLALLALDLETPDLAAHIAAVAPGGRVVALAPLGQLAARLEAALADQGLQIASSDAQLSPLGLRLIRAIKAAPAAPTRIEYVTYAHYLMDIRTSLPTDGLRTEPELELELNTPPFAQTLADPRILILQRAPSVAPAVWQSIAARAILAGQVIVAEFDDHPDLTSLILRGRHATDGEWEQFRVAHAVQTSTDQLLPVFGAHNPEVRAFQNCVFDLPPFPETERGPRVFYGAIDRGPFAVEVARSLAPAIEAFPSVEFHVVGDRAVFDALPTARKRFDPLLPYARYLAAMAECSVSLSPIMAAPMVETKSDAKYLDAARAGVLTLASPVLYDRVIRHGENGLLARSISDWPRLLTFALADAPARQRMSRAAWEDVRGRRMFSQQIAERRDWYRDLLRRREVLNRALVERSPGVAAALAKLRSVG
jgi:hypothetical protein